MHNEDFNFSSQILRSKEFLWNHFKIVQEPSNKYYDLSVHLEMFLYVPITNSYILQTEWLTFFPHSATCFYSI